MVKDMRTIWISLELKECLDGLKVHGREPYGDVISRLVVVKGNYDLLRENNR